MLFFIELLWNKNPTLHNQKKIYKIQHSNRIVLLFFNVILGFAMNIYGTLSQPFLYSLFESETKVGIIVSLASFFMFLPQFWSGNISDRFGRKFCQGLGLVFMIISMISLGFFVQMIINVIGIMFLNIGYGIHSPAFNSFISENKPSGKSASNFGFMYFAYFIGSVSANTLINVLGEDYSYTFYFRLVFIIVCLWLILQSFLLKEKVLMEQRKQRIEEIKAHALQTQNDEFTKSKWRIIIETPRIRNLIIYLTFDGLIWSIVLSVYYSGLIANFGVQKEFIAQLALVFSISNMVGQIPAGKIVDKIGTQKSLIWSVVAGFGLFGSILIAWFAKNNNFTIWLIIGQIFFAISVVLYLPAQSSLATSFSEHRNAEIFGIIMAIKGIGLIPAGIIGGYLMENIHFLAPIIITLCCLPVEILFLYFYLPDKELSLN